MHQRSELSPLRALVSEAIYSGARTATLKTLQDPYVVNYKAHRRDSSVTKLRLKRHTLNDYGELLVYIAENEGKRWDDPRHADTSTARHEHIISKQEFRDLLRSLGFTERAIRDVEFDFHGGDRSGAIAMNVNDRFISDWRRLFGTEKVVDLT